MTLSICISILLLIVASHQVLAHGVGRCGNDKYLHSGICCNLCPAGTHLVADCTLSTDTICTPCDGGHTYTAYPNRLHGCIRCKHCDGHVGLVVKPGGACVPTKNTECQCREGMYHPHESSQVCVNHSTCPQGEEVAKKGTNVSDTVCRPCPDGTFSNRESLTKCRPWRNCTAMGMKTVRNGTSTRNARCEPFPTTSTEKLPASSQTVAPVTPVPMMVNTTTVRMRKSTPNSASTTATTTAMTTYRSRSAFTTAMQVTAAPTSTMHPSTTATNPTAQQTVDNIPSPYTTQATMSATPRSFDTNPEVDGGDGPNRHGNKAPEIAIAAIVGVIAVLLGLFVIAYHVPKLLERRQRRRRLQYEPFSLSDTPVNLEEDNNLQEGDLEEEMLQVELSEDNVGQDRRTTRGATPGDNTCPHEVVSLLPSQEGTLPHDTRGAEGLPAIPVTDIHLVKLARVMPEHWRTIGMEHFQITTQDLDRFRTKYEHDRDMQIVEMFKSWVVGKGKMTKLPNLCQKLNDAGIEWRVLYGLFGDTQPKTLVD